MRVLLTGGSGMLGSAVLRLNSNFDIIAPSREVLDLRDQNAVQAYFKGNNFDAVIHCAAKVGGIKANMNDQAGFLTDNLFISTNVIEAARKFGVQKFINIGSSCMYPRNIDRPIMEVDLLTAPLEPTNEGYALAKITAAKLCEYFSTQDGRHYKTLIPCNMYGPHDAYDLEQSHLLPAAILKIHHAIESGASSVVIWGDGLARREFIFVGDFACFVLKALGDVEILPACLNCGLGHDLTVNEYYAAVKNALGYGGVFEHDGNQPVGMQRKLMDSSCAFGLGWKPATSISDGLRITYDSFLEEL